LLDNDRVQEDLRRHLEESYGTLFEELRSELGYADYLGALERYRTEELHDPRCGAWRTGWWITRSLIAGTQRPSTQPSTRSNGAPLQFSQL
jgi:hypothetical protein